MRTLLPALINGRPWLTCAELQVCCKPGAVIRRAVQINDEAPVASQIVPYPPPRFASLSTIPSSRQGSTILQMHLSDEPHFSSDPVEPVATNKGQASSSPSSSRPSSRNTRAPKSRLSASSRLTVERPRTGNQSSQTTQISSMIATRHKSRTTAEGSDHPLVSVEATSALSAASIVHTKVPGENVIARPSDRSAQSHLLSNAFSTPAGAHTVPAPRSIKRARTVSTYDESPAARRPRHQAAMDPPSKEQEVAEAKRTAKEKEKFMAVRPISPVVGKGGGPFSYYGNGERTGFHLLQIYPYASLYRVLHARHT